MLSSGKGDHPGLCASRRKHDSYLSFEIGLKKINSDIHNKHFYCLYSTKTSFISHLDPVSFASECEDGEEKTLSRHNIVNRGYGRISC